MSKRRQTVKVSSIEETKIRERIAAAERDFQALLDRHQMVPVVEQGISSVAGQFTRFTFLPRPTEAPKPVDPVTAK